jgi:hypothetical protein
VTLALSTNGAATGSASSVVSAPALSVGGTSLVRNLGRPLGDALLLLLAVLSLPFAILLIGMPIAVCVRLILELARRL